MNLQRKSAMRAIVQDAYGSPSVLQLKDIDTPAIGTHDVLIRVHAASLHMGDWHMMTGLPYMLRVVVPDLGLRGPKVRVRGMDVAGTVEAVGAGVTQFQVGDDVFGTCQGAFAEYASAPQDNLALKPANLTFEQAAAIPTSAFAALQALRDAGGLKAGQHVLIVGASGGVGTFAVQIAKALGAEVTGVCSTSKVELVRSIGADHVIDYTQHDFAQGGQRYDLVLDVGGNRSLADLRHALRPGGTLVLAGGEGGGRWIGSTDRWIQALAVAPFVADKLRPLATKPNQADLQVISQLVEAGQVRPVVDRSYPLSEVPEAIRYLKNGQARGKVVVAV